MTDHRAIAEQLLETSNLDTTTLLRAIGHAILSTTQKPLFFDAYNPKGTE